MFFSGQPQLWILACTILLLSACSTYHSNSEFEFDSVHLSGQKPALPIVKKLPADQITYLGWVEAEVYSPSLFHEAPSQEQVNIVIADKAQRLQADAIMHVEYKDGFTMSAKARLVARGQAVRINAWHVGEDDPNVVMADNSNVRAVDPFLTALEAAAIETEQQDNAKQESTQAVTPQTATAPTPKASASNLDAKPAQGSLLTQNHAKSIDQADLQAQTLSLYQIRHEASEIKNIAKKHQDKALYKSSSALMHLIDQHILEYTDNFPE